MLGGFMAANQEQWHHAHGVVKALREELPKRPGAVIEIHPHAIGRLMSHVPAVGCRVFYHIACALFRSLLQASEQQNNKAKKNQRIHIHHIITRWSQMP
jgi:hypothetical protein